MFNQPAAAGFMDISHIYHPLSCVFYTILP